MTPPIVIEWESVSVFCYRGEKTWAPECWRTDEGGGGVFLIRYQWFTNVAEMTWFSVFFLNFFVSPTFLCVCWKIRNSQIYSRAKKYAYLDAFMSWSAKRLGSGARAPLTFWNGMLQRKRKKEREKKISDLPMSQMRYQNMLIWP